MNTILEEQIAKTMRLLGEPHSCGWANCTKQFYGDGPPPGWMTLSFSRYQRQRDVILCPTHGSDFERELKPHKLYEIKLLLRGAAYYAGSPVPWETFGPKGVLG